jgi:hypothetical protein
LNRLPTAGERITDEAFSWVMVHAWSRFRKAGKNAPLDAEEKDVAQDREGVDVARGYEPALWAVERLESQVKPVTANELLLRIRLRLRSQATLTRWLAEVKDNAGARRPVHELREKAAQIRNLLPQTGHDAIAARRCFELLKHLY